MSGKHTPGPWIVDSSSTKIISESGAYICEGLDWSEHHEANANLIAAAPELLEALEDTMRIIGPPEYAQWANEDEISTAWNSAVAAIAKAKGGYHE